MASSEKSGGPASNGGRRSAKSGSNVATRTIPAQLEPPAQLESPAQLEPDVSTTAHSGTTPALNFDPGAALDAWRRALAPALRTQLEALKAIERFGRYQYSFAGDYLEWGVAQARAGLGFRTPAEQIASQTTLATQFGEKLQGRVREFVNLASETRSSFSDCWGK
jgi:hypothetical protein